MTIEKRKDDHIDICLTKDIRTSYNHWDDVHLVHQSIPRCDLDDVDLEVEFLGKKLSAPLVISAMTGGSDKADTYNKNLARAAEEFGIGLGVGSQRAGIEKKEHVGSYTVVRDHKIPLVMANLGAPQFAVNIIDEERQYGMDEVKKAMEMVGGDAVCVHFNYLQEVVQPEGDTNVKGVMENIKEISRHFKVIGKETGAGFSREAALILKEAGVSAIDVGGASGTSFSAVESFRAGSKHEKAERAGTIYWNWGIPTPISIKLAQVGLPIIGTGGLRNGLDVVRALALGAEVGGMAWPLLKPASAGYDVLKNEIEKILNEIRIGFFLSGATGTSDIKNTNSFFTGKTREMMNGMFE
jgi:isopentenyl-diphosphate delta-isomerase